MIDATSATAISINVNGTDRQLEVEPRLLLSDALRRDLGLTGTHVGCEHGVCGACTVLLDGAAVRSCLLFAIQADCCDIRTVESLTRADGSLSEIPAAFRDEHGLQCGFCTPGIMMSLAELADTGGADTDSITSTVAGHLCRCTGYRNIMRAAERGLGLTSEPASTIEAGSVSASTADPR
jgi:aerobic-type carbon monoxide dehydrogenase small subunit (CoxS/CutS family)